MLEELKPVWRQLEEIYDALDAVMGEIPDGRLDWRPAPKATTTGYLAQHVARANITYANVMRTGERGWRFEPEPGLSREAITERVRMSREHVRNVFETLPLDRLHARCADDWAGLGPLVAGPLDALWFAHLMVAHSAYHVGQLNYITLLMDA